MAVQRDSSYWAYAPSDIQDLLEELAEEGIDGRNPVWSVGRLDKRHAGNGDGNGNGNGNGSHDPEGQGNTNGDDTDGDGD
jgi:hypothetical protein